MKHYILSLLLLIYSLNSVAQVTIGSDYKPVLGSLLDLKETDDEGANSTKGLLLPRVNITQLDVLKTDINIGSDDPKSYAGLMIYNATENAGQCLIIPKGVYTWNGEQWQAIGTNKPIVVTPEGTLKDELLILKNLKTKYAPHLDAVIPDNDIDDTNPTSNPHIGFKELCGQMRVDWVNFGEIPAADKAAVDDVTPLTQIPGLRTLVLDGFNNISKLDLSMARHLDFCSVQNTNLSEINISNSYLLRVLQLENTKVSTINVSKNLLLTSLDLNNTKVSTVDVSKNTKLEILRLRNLENLTTLDVSNNPMLFFIFVDGTKLSKLDMSNNINTEIRAFQFTSPTNPSIPTYFTSGSIKLPSRLKSLFQSVDPGSYNYIYPSKNNSIFKYIP